MQDREEFAPEERDADFELYDAAPPDMPPSPAGADVEIGGEAASSRRTAGLPADLAARPEFTPGRPTPDPEPFLGYDSLATSDVLDWIAAADPEVDRLRAIYTYERAHRDRDPITLECMRRIRALGDSTES